MMPKPLDLITPNWPAPARVRACVSTRAGGSSQGAFASCNLGAHVGDAPQAVAHNRAQLAKQLGCRLAYLTQVHGTTIVAADAEQCLQADASWTQTPGLACCVLTADCLPLLFCDRAASRVAAVHAGWRGLAAGILEETLKTLALPPQEILVWMGPAIGQKAFEVGEEVRAAFVDVQGEAAAAFIPGAKPCKYQADLYQLARLRLAERGVTAVYGGSFCTFSDPRFYSYRRSNPTGRQASLIWLNA